MSRTAPRLIARREPRWQRVLRGAPVLVEALGALAFASAAIRLLPMRRIVGLASRPLGRRRAEPAQALTRARWAVEALARRVPWRAVCFQQGLALQRMLRRRGVPAVLHYGIAQEADKLTAHVWVTVDDSIVIGAPAARTHHGVATFPAESTT